MNLKETIRDIYNKRVKFIEYKNVEVERRYFTEYIAQIPLSEFIEGMSYYDVFESLKESIKKSHSEADIKDVYDLLDSYYLFSNGHDMMFKHKLKADFYYTTPIESLIYEKMENEIEKSFTDLSIIPENPDRDKNMNAIDRIIYDYTEANSLIYLLYCFDWFFPDGWENAFPGFSDRVLEIIDNSDIKIGEFLHALIDEKCKKICYVLSSIEDEKLKDKYMNMAEELKKSKHAEVDTFAHIHLPITYFKNHGLFDFEPNEAKNILLNTPKN